MADPDDLDARILALADECAAAAAEHERRAAELRGRERALRAQVAGVERAQGLQPRPGPAKVFNEHMDAAALARRNQAISSAKASDPLSQAARAAGFAGLRDLARAVGRSVGSLSNWRDGTHPCPADVAKSVKDLTGFDAWPGGIAD